MSIRFAPARTLAPLRNDPEARARAFRFAANDNRVVVHTDEALSAALRHFATHGLAAAQHARDNAEAALSTGNEAEFQWWVDICRLLDRRMADRLELSQQKTTRAS